MGDTINLDGNGNGADATTAVPPKEKKRTPTEKKLAADIASTYQTIGVALVGFGMHREDKGILATGVKVTESAEAVAEAWLDVAEKNPAVKRALVKMTTASDTFALVMLHGNMLLPFLADRRILPAAMTSAMGMNGNGNGDVD